MSDLPKPPEWLQDFLSEICLCFGAHLPSDEPSCPQAAVKYNWTPPHPDIEGDCWETVVYPAPIEIVGGAQDGLSVSPYFSADISAMLNEFDQKPDPPDVFWEQTTDIDDHQGTVIIIEGKVNGNDLILQLFEQPRVGASADIVFDTSKSSYRRKRK